MLKKEVKQKSLYINLYLRNINTEYTGRAINRGRAVDGKLKSSLEWPYKLSLVRKGVTKSKRRSFFRCFLTAIVLRLHSCKCFSTFCAQLLALFYAVVVFLLVIFYKRYAVCCFFTPLFGPNYPMAVRITPICYKAFVPWWRAN